MGRGVGRGRGEGEGWSKGGGGANTIVGISSLSIAVCCASNHPRELGGSGGNGVGRRE